MDSTRFEAMVARLEQDSKTAPGMYQFKVALLALAGFGVLTVILGLAGLGLFLIGGLALAILFSGGTALLLLLKLGKLLIFLAIPLWVLIKSSISALFTRLPPPQGQEIQRSQAPALFAAMDQMRQQMKGPRFHHVLITDDLNAAVVQRPLFGLIGWPRNYLILGLPLLEAVSPQEALAIVAHEYGHLAGSHSRFAAFIYRLRNTWGTICAIADQWSGWTGRRLRAIVGWYAPYFNAYTFVLARAHEYQADAASGELVGPEVTISALKRFNLVAQQHQQFFDDTLKSISEQASPPQDMAMRWAQVAVLPVEAAQAQHWLQQALNREPGAMDTHPALKQRLQALTQDAEALTQVPQPVQGDTAASRWLGQHVQSLRQQFQSEWAKRVAEPWSQRFEAVQVQKQRLAELEDMAEPTLAEQAEIHKLRVRLHPDDDHLPALAAFNAAHPDQPLTLYLEADLRLHQQDESGLALLERVMDLDADAIKPACERAWQFLTAQGDAERAQPYQTRWQQRHEWEQAKAMQMDTLDVTHELRPAQDLSDTARLHMHGLVQKNRQGIRRAYLVRRVLPADPDQATYVVAVELTAWARFRKKGGEIIQRLAAQEWPEHVFICVLNNRQYKPMQRKLARLKDVHIPL